jgi:hypothetical protein
MDIKEICVKDVDWIQPVQAVAGSLEYRMAPFRLRHFLNRQLLLLLINALVISTDDSSTTTPKSIIRSQFTFLQNCHPV